MTQQHREDPLLWIPRLLRKAYSIWLGTTYPFDAFGSGVSIHYTCEIHRFYAHKIRIEDSVIVDSNVWLNVPFIATDPEPAIILSKGTRVGRRSVISARNSVLLGEDVLLAPGVFITDHNHEYGDIEKPIAAQGINIGGRITIERNCWLGYGSMILGTKGDLTVGRNSVVGAYSVVTQSVPAFSVVAGNPAKVVKRFDTKSGKWQKSPENPLTSLSPSVGVASRY